MIDLLQALQARGVSIRIDADDLIVNPRSLLTDALRDDIRADKPELLRLPNALAAAIDRCCDARGDDDANRAALMYECLALPAWEQREWRDHFNKEADRNDGVAGTRCYRHTCRSRPRIQGIDARPATT